MPGSKTLHSVTWSCRGDFRDGKFSVQIQRNLKVKKYEFEFLKGRNTFSGNFKLARACYLEQQTSNRIPRPTAKGDFYHLKSLLKLFACSCRV